ncbi:MAG: hypothetical protein HY766_16030 [candidate division NC10 bacterium]|nr:hypothetical protein [candidate division NC10 bacterium]
MIDSPTYLWVTVLGQPAYSPAAALGVRPQSVYRAVVRAQECGAEWRQLLAK